MMWQKLSNRSKAVASSLLLLTLLSGCGNNGCEEIRESYCLTSLKSVSSAGITSLYAWGIGDLSHLSDSLMLSASNPTEMELRLDPNAEQTQIRLQMTTTYYGETSQREDTLTIRYKVDPHFIDMECGCTVYFTIQSAECTKNFLRDIRITNPIVSNEENVNLTIDF